MINNSTNLKLFMVLLAFIGMNTPMIVANNPASVDYSNAFTPTNCGAENFANVSSGTSYITRTWTGLNNVPWKATDSRGDQNLNGADAIILRNGSLTNETTVSGGMGTISFDYARKYTGNSTLKVFVNGTQYGGDITVSELTSSTFTFDVNISGNINLELRNSSQRTIINNLSWTCYAPTSTCSITDFLLDNISSCNDNGTSGDLTDDYFTADVWVEATTDATPAPTITLTGLDIVGTPPTATYDNGGITIFTNVKLKADGDDVNMIATFSDNNTCALDTTLVGSAVSPCSVECGISSIVLSNATSCNDNGTTSDGSDDYFTGDITVNYSGQPSSGSLDISSSSILSGTLTTSSFTGTSYTFTGIQFKANGIDLAITAAFSANSSCTLTSTLAGSGVNPCVPFSITPGIIINEFSQVAGLGYAAEWVECLVVGVPGTTVDLRNWIFDDNNGDFSNGVGDKAGIARGHIRFSNNCTWEKVPVGSIILFYNAQSNSGTGYNGGFTFNGIADDPTDENNDFLYVVPIDGTSSDYFEGCNIEGGSLPYSGGGYCNTGSSSYGPVNYGNAKWTSVGYRNDGDATQIRKPDHSYNQGISYTSSSDETRECNGETIDITLQNHPDFATSGNEAVHFTNSSGDVTYKFTNAVDNNYLKKSNWASSTTSAEETPGVGNTPQNAAFIASLRGDFPPTILDSEYTCLLRSEETRTFLNNSDEIILWVKNNGTTNHGSTTASIKEQSDNISSDKKNLNLSDMPLLMDIEWELVPTNLSGADYTIRLYINSSTLTDYTNYITTNYPTSGVNSEQDVLDELKMYKFNSNDDPYTTSNGEVASTITQSNIIIGNETFYTFEASFTSFSKFKLGIPMIALAPLPVELVSFNAKKVEESSLLLWETATEQNSDYFEIQRSIDGLDFNSIGRVKSSGNSLDFINYRFIDERPSIGNNYYRLKQVDIDGQFEYSDIRNVIFRKTGTEIFVYPTLATDEIVVEFPDNEDYQSLQVYDILGHSYQIFNCSGSRCAFDITNLPTGHYIVKHKNSTARFIKK